MGVPRLYRWFSKRYPSLVSPADASGPRVDNLYLDLNGIVHQRSHGPGCGSKADEIIFVECFSDICALVDLVAPNKLVYLALDGVAPRAKLNQQRARRFSTAKERAAAGGQRPLNGSKPDDFDSNCITPGTEFMAGLGDAFVFLIQQKMRDDSAWAGLDVILSPTSVPGEGEHKIMEFIRQRHDEPNTVHCAYGADADLMLLALCTHEPHFLVLREAPQTDFNEPIGGPSARLERGCPPMQYISIGLLREYLALELRPPQGAPRSTEDFDLERALDDFVLLTFLVGNDFLPHLPTVDISTGSLEALLMIYRHLLSSWETGGYLTTRGHIEWHRLETILERLGHLEPHAIDAGSGGRRRGRKGAGSDTAKIARIVLKRVAETCAVDPAVQLEFDRERHALHQTHKHSHYVDKHGFKPGGARHRGLCREYLRGLAWTLQYYTRGCCSWSWFFPYHYGPFISDLVDDIHEHCIYEIGWSLGQPYTPLQQLLAVLPPSSAWALPAPYRAMMTDPSSEIADFYPVDFATDANGKRNSWEHTVLLCFVDEPRLLAAAATVSSLWRSPALGCAGSLCSNFAVGGMPHRRSTKLSSQRQSFCGMRPRFHCAFQ